MDAAAEAATFEHFSALTKDRIVEQGTHEELMQQGGRYRRLFELQARGYS